jgi:release factor glutamine methyltransferase
MASRDRKTDPVGNLGEWRRSAAVLFRNQGFESPAAEADAIAGHVLDLSRSELLINRDRRLNHRERQRLLRLVAWRVDHVPLQYLLGKVDFGGVSLRVRRGVFIPRPETEGLVEKILAGFEPGDGGTVVDAGTGTGAIALSLARERPRMTVLATEISPRAAGLARVNARALGVEGRIRILEGDLLDPIPRDLPLAGVISNPPYIAGSDRSMLAPEVIDHEPHRALFADDDGMSVIRRLVEEAVLRLEEDGLLALEIGDDQGERVRALLTGSGNWNRIRIERDLAGKDRYALARRVR